MKKYKQLLLVIISLVSLSLLLIYRHEYNRLHYVLEVFNFFGQPCNFSALQISENVMNHHDWGPQPLWQESEGVHLYSAFWTKKKEAKVIVLQADKTVVARSCYLWFEDKLKPAMGKFKFAKIAHDDVSKQSAFFFYCSLVNSEISPYAVSFSMKVKKSSALKKVLLENSAVHRVNINTTICVSPTEFKKSDLLEFLSFHKLIGVESYIFYADYIPYRLMKIVTNLSARVGIRLTFFPWNMPKMSGTLTRIIVEQDCLLRALGQSKNVLILEIDEYVVPTLRYSLDQVLLDYDPKYMSERLSLPVQTFCLKSTDRQKPVALQNTKVSFDNDKTVRYIYRSATEKSVVSTQAVIKDVASIHKYVPCVENIKTYSDQSILRFSTDFIRSTLVQLFLHDQI